MAYWAISSEGIQSTTLEYSDGSEAFDSDMSYESYTRGAEYPYPGNDDLQVPYPSDSLSDTFISGTTDPAFSNSINYPPNSIVDTETNWSSSTTGISACYQAHSGH